MRQPKPRTLQELKAIDPPIDIGWEKVLYDTELKLAETEILRARLRVSFRLVKKFIEEKRPWPC